MNTMPPPRVCDAVETRELLAFDALMDAVRRAAVEVGQGLIHCPERLVVALGAGASMLSMPAVADDIAIHKLITVTPGNAGSVLPAIQGHVTILDKATGRIRLLLDGPTVTGRRTAAVSMLALQVLARRPIVDVLVIGAGAQARHHVEALAAIRPGVRVQIRGRSLAAAEAFCRDAGGLPIAVSPDAGEPVFDAVIACTSSSTPVYVDAARTDTLIVAVGSFSPDAAEIAAATVRASTVYVDDPVGARHEAGDLIQAGVDWRRVRSLVDALDGPPASGPLLFKSVGCAAWDLAAARVAIAASRACPGRARLL